MIGHKLIKNFLKKVNKFVDNHFYILYIIKARLRYTADVKFGVWRSLVARLLWEQKVGGSNPFTPTSNLQRNQRVGL